MTDELSDCEASGETCADGGSPNRSSVTSSGDCGGDDAPGCICPPSGTMGTLGRKYSLQVMCVVGALEPVRFNAVEANVPDASTSTLSDRLDDLEAEGLIDRTQYDEIPPRVEYELTEDGHELHERLRPLVEWMAERDE